MSPTIFFEKGYRFYFFSREEQLCTCTRERQGEIERAWERHLRG